MGKEDAYWAQRSLYEGRLSNIYWKEEQRSMRMLRWMMGIERIEKIRTEEIRVKPASDYQLIRRSWPTGRLPTLPTI